MSVKVVVVCVVLALALSVGAWAILKTGSAVHLNTFTADSLFFLPGLQFSYPDSLGNPVVKIASNSIIKLEFPAINQGSSNLKILLGRDDSLSKYKSFQEMIQSTYGYTPKSPHNPSIAGDTSVGAFATIAGKEALKVIGYGGDSNHSLYVLNVGSGSVLVVAIQGAPLDQAIRDQIANSMRFNWHIYANSEHGFSVQYPNDYEVVLHDATNPFIEICRKGALPHRTCVEVSVLTNSFNSFDTFANDKIQNLITFLARANKGQFATDKEVQDEVLSFAGRYSFMKDTVAGIPVLFHQRDFYVLDGPVHYMYAETKPGTVLQFSGGPSDLDVVDSIYQTLQKAP